MIPDTAMEILGKTVETIRTEGQNHFRCSKSIARLQRITESFLLQAYEGTGLIKLIFLHFCLKASAVHKKSYYSSFRNLL